MVLICSNSTRKFFPDIKEVEIINGPADDNFLNKKDMFDNAIVVGGGAVVDAAKILVKNNITCYPTTAAGSCMTSHSVYWRGPIKKSIRRFIPQKTVIVDQFVKDLPESVVTYTFYDVFSHCLDVLWSTEKNRDSVKLVHSALDILKGPYSNSDLVLAGNLAGAAIEICPTTLLHSLSYPLTGFYGIPHGKALGFLVPYICSYMDFDIDPYILHHKKVDLSEYNIDFRLVVDTAMTYNKIDKLERKVDLGVILNLLSKGV